MKLNYTFVIFLALMFAGCTKSSETPPTTAVPARQEPPATPTSGASGSTVAVAHGGGERAPLSAPVTETASPGGPQSAGGLSWSAPKRWTIGPERSMRVATYRVPASSGDTEDGECAVFFFGAGQGGGVEANIERWIGQFEQPDGKPSSERAKRQTETINGMSVAMVALNGTYKGGGPAMGGSGGSKAGYRLLGAIVSGPQAGIFFKLTGPEKTVAAAEKEFRSMLSSIHQ